MFGLVPCLQSQLLAEDLFAPVGTIFEKRCVSCHNNAEAKGGLSLTSANSFNKGGESGAAVEPGSADFSLLVEYISGDEPQMPKIGKPLTKAEVVAIRNWIDAGAVWPKDQKLADMSLADTDWWSLKPIKKSTVPVPSVKYANWTRNEVDAFVLAKLLEKGLTPSPVADKRALIRRVTFDLTGLPPTPEEVKAFLTDADPTAYEKLVDRLLTSDRYGERWARHWLDVVKYADTHGYDKDKLRPNAWPYRDFVIRSFNQDKPYGRFVQEQLAGDYLFPGEPDSIVALGFLAAGPWDFIGHVEVPESKLDGKVARNLDRDDMVSNTLNTFCSATVQCARCHNHKFDPITQKHYYRLQAVFAAVDRADRPYESNADSPRQQLERQLASLKKTKAELAAEFAKQGGKQLAELEQRVATLRSQVQAVKKDAEFGYHSATVGSETNAKWVEVDSGVDTSVDQIVLHPCHDDFAGIGAGFGFPVQFQVTGRTSAGQEVTLADYTNADFPNPGVTPVSIRPGINAKQTEFRYVRVTASKLSERKKDYIFALAELEVLDKSGMNLALGKPVESLDTIEAPVRWGRKNLVDGKWAKPVDEKAADEFATARQELAQFKEKHISQDLLKSIENNDLQIADSNRRLASLPQASKVFAVATYFAPQGNFRATGGTARPIHVLHRGNVTDPKEAVTAGTIPLTKDDPGELDCDSSAPEASRRAALARWIVDKEHPLTWRSIVNRVWLYHFGQGLVATPNDFGRMGAEPTHPELLDWLALEFRDNGQSFKKLHKLIVLSSTYQQASAFRPDAAKVDGSNQFLWRMNRRRLEAEEIRDAVLSVSGKLNNTMGGPGYYLFALEKTAHSPHYEYHKFDSTDSKSHRRSIYRFVVRSQPNPFMSVLDCADSSQSTPKRDETLTSLQALALLNNNFNLTMSEYFAERLSKEAETLDEQISLGMWLVTARSPTQRERAVLTTYAREHGLKNLCRVMLNLSEFVYLD